MWRISETVPASRKWRQIPGSCSRRWFLWGKRSWSGQRGAAAFGGHYYGSERGIRHAAGACAELCSDSWSFAGGVYCSYTGERSFGSLLRGAEYFHAPGDRDHCRSGGGHCRNHRHCEKLGCDHGMVREPVAGSISKAGGIMERADGLFYGDNPGSVPDLHQLFSAIPDW